eukprot:TRINITY_DN9110_c0_g1_i1.p1 TRINITY_DN9110_c0_g1~~TRINITY_DN9110_c0_g1_i1.p1  ORF type:complete len:1502 (+),score=435.02 TRINITY_DN9110_c0_g1_i1:194-4507(+)
MIFAVAAKDLVVDQFGYKSGKEGFGQMFEDVWQNREDPIVSKLGEECENLLRVAPGSWFGFAQSFNSEAVAAAAADRLGSKRRQLMSSSQEPASSEDSLGKVEIVVQLTDIPGLADAEVAVTVAKTDTLLQVKRATAVKLWQERDNRQEDPTARLSQQLLEAESEKLASIGTMAAPIGQSIALDILADDEPVGDRQRLLWVGESLEEPVGNGLSVENDVDDFDYIFPNAAPEGFEEVNARESAEVTDEDEFIDATTAGNGHETNKLQEVEAATQECEVGDIQKPSEFLGMESVANENTALDVQGNEQNLESERAPVDALAEDGDVIAVPTAGGEPEERNRAQHLAPAMEEGGGVEAMQTVANPDASGRVEHLYHQSDRIKLDEAVAVEDEIIDVRTSCNALEETNEQHHAEAASVQDKFADVQEEEHVREEEAVAEEDVVHGAQPDKEKHADGSRHSEAALQEHEVAGEQDAEAEAVVQSQKQARVKDEGALQEAELFTHEQGALEMQQNPEGKERERNEEVAAVPGVDALNDEQKNADGAEVTKVGNSRDPFRLVAMLPDSASDCQIRILGDLLQMISGSVVRKSEASLEQRAAVRVLELSELSSETKPSDCEGRVVLVQSMTSHGPGGHMLLRVPNDATVGFVQDVVAERCGGGGVATHIRMVRRLSDALFLPLARDEALGTRSQLLLLGVDLAGVEEMTHAESSGLLIAAMEVLEDPGVQEDLMQLDGGAIVGDLLAAWDPPWAARGLEELDADTLAGVPGDEVKAWAKSFANLVAAMREALAKHAEQAQDHEDDEVIDAVESDKELDYDDEVIDAPNSVKDLKCDDHHVIDGSSFAKNIKHHDVEVTDAPHLVKREEDDEAIDALGSADGREHNDVEVDDAPTCINDLHDDDDEIIDVPCSAKVPDHDNAEANDDDHDDDDDDDDHDDDDDEVIDAPSSAKSLQHEDVEVRDPTTSVEHLEDDDDDEVVGPPSFAIGLGCKELEVDDAPNVANDLEGDDDDVIDERSPAKGLGREDVEVNDAPKPVNGLDDDEDEAIDVPPSAKGLGHEDAEVNDASNSVKDLQNDDGEVIDAPSSAEDLGHEDAEVNAASNSVVDLEADDDDEVISAPSSAKDLGHMDAEVNDASNSVVHVEDDDDEVIDAPSSAKDLGHKDAEVNDASNSVLDLDDDDDEVIDAPSSAKHLGHIDAEVNDAPNSVKDPEDDGDEVIDAPSSAKDLGHKDADVNDAPKSVKDLEDDDDDDDDEVIDAPTSANDFRHEDGEVNDALNSVNDLNDEDDEVLDATELDVGSVIGVAHSAKEHGEHEGMNFIDMLEELGGRSAVKEDPETVKINESEMEPEQEPDLDDCDDDAFNVVMVELENVYSANRVAIAVGSDVSMDEVRSTLEQALGLRDATGLRLLQSADGPEYLDTEKLGQRRKLFYLGPEDSLKPLAG